MSQSSIPYDAMPIGIVMRRAPGVTRWAKWSWKASGVLPGAGDADWRVLRQDGEVTEFHAATRTLELHRTDAESYLHGLTAEVPSIYVVLRATEDEARPFDVVLATVSPYEAQDYADNGEDVIEKIPMPEVVAAWVADFAQAHYHAEAFKKRRRDKKDVTLVEDGIGDPRIAQLADVYSSPARIKKERLQ